MRNITTALTQLLDTRSTTRAVSIVKSMVGDDLWLVADAISGVEQIVSGSGMNVGDYVLHEDRKLVTNLGAVEMIVTSV